MITYDYRIEREVAADKVQIFTPKIPQKLPSLVVIEGPNSSGKSTLLNMIALGLLAANSKKTNPLLQNKMRSLLDSDYQRVEFEITITSDDEDIVLKSRKGAKTKEILLEESVDGRTFRPIDYQRFERKYNLIYDIPNNPTERLYELVQELQEEQDRFGKRFERFSQFLRKITSEIRTNRDPKRLEALRKTREQTVKEREVERTAVPELERFLELLEKHAYVQYFFFYRDQFVKLDVQRRKLENETRKMKTKGRKVSKTAEDLKRDIGDLQEKIAGVYREVTPVIEKFLPRGEKGRVEIWKDLSPYGLDDLELARLKRETSHFWYWFDSEIKNASVDDSWRNASVLERIIQALKEFESSKIRIPEAENTIRDLIQILEKENKKNAALLSKQQNMKTIFGHLQTLLQLIDKLKERRNDKEQLLTSSGLTDTGDSDETELSLKSIKRELDASVKKSDFYYQKCQEKGIDAELLAKGSMKEVLETIPSSSQVEPYLSSSEDELETRISKLRKEIEERKNKIIKFSTLIGVYDKDIGDLQKQKPHKYEGHLDKLDMLLRKSDQISQKILQQFRDNLRGLSSGAIKEKDVEGKKGEKRYFDEVSKYLAHRIGSFRHVDLVYKAKSIDLISGVIVTDGGVTIHLADMGTGQSQSAYLVGLLNVKNDPRKIIALFDEIAMMDDSSLEPLYDKLRTLYREKRLLLGILVQKSNSINIRDLTPVK